jgi:hypothetical protein
MYLSLTSEGPHKTSQDTASFQMATHLGIDGVCVAWGGIGFEPGTPYIYKTSFTDL